VHRRHRDPSRRAGTLAAPPSSTRRPLAVPPLAARPASGRGKNAMHI
jgi:hypothetical protein